MIKTKPIAKTINDNKIFYIGENGKLFQDNIKNLKIPLIKGNFEINKTNKFLNLLKETSFSLSEIKFLIFFPSERWDVIFKDGRTIRLPKNNTHEAIKKVELLLKDGNFNKKTIDLRINNKIIISDE